MSDLNENEGQIDYPFAFGFLRSKVKMIIEEELFEEGLDDGINEHPLMRKFREAVVEARQEGRKYFKHKQLRE